MSDKKEIKDMSLGELYNLIRVKDIRIKKLGDEVDRLNAVFQEQVALNRRLQRELTKRIDELKRYDGYRQDLHQRCLENQNILVEYESLFEAIEKDVKEYPNDVRTRIKYAIEVCRGKVKSIAEREIQPDPAATKLPF